MTDRLTQLQEAVNCQAENLCNAIGILQQYAPPSPFSEFERPAPTEGADKQQQQQPAEDYPQMFAQCIVKTAKDIDVLIDSLPSEDSTPELQAACLRRLELDNQEAATKLEDAVKRCEKLLEKVQGILRNVARAQLAAAATTLPPKSD
uniref:Mediator of RNA polymerase II transcription subunit 21 n=1 Tax=Aceria tosichella TaxID=561515 RepID=A0A6G1SBG9_9ACAR